MKTWKVIACGAATLAAATLVAGVAVAQLAPPAGNQGVSAKLIGALNLHSQVPEIGNRQLRLRLVTIAPGGALAMHDHKDRPSVEMLLTSSPA